MKEQYTLDLIVLRQMTFRYAKGNNAPVTINIFLHIYETYTIFIFDVTHVG